MVTYARQANLGREAELEMAQQMNHSIGTADQIYDVGKKFDVTSRFRNTLSKIFDTLKESQADTEEHDACDDPHAEDDPPATEEDPSVNMDEEMPNLETTIPDQPKKTRKVFLPADVNQLKNAAGHWMRNIQKTKAQVKIKELEEVLQQSDDGRKLLTKFSLAQVYTRARHMVKGIYKF